MCLCLSLIKRYILSAGENIILFSVKAIKSCLLSASSSQPVDKNMFTAPGRGIKTPLARVCLSALRLQDRERGWMDSCGTAGTHNAHQLCAEKEKK